MNATNLFSDEIQTVVEDMNYAYRNITPIMIDNYDSFTLNQILEDIILHIKNTYDSCTNNYGRVLIFLTPSLVDTLYDMRGNFIEIIDCVLHNHKMGSDFPPETKVFLPTERKALTLKSIKSINDYKPNSSMFRIEEFNSCVMEEDWKVGIFIGYDMYNYSLNKIFDLQCFLKIVDADKNFNYKVVAYSNRGKCLEEIH